MKKIAVLGSTGSIGRSTLDVVRRTGCAEIVGLAANGSDADLLEAQIREFNPAVVSVNIEAAALHLKRAFPSVEVLLNGVATVAATPDAQTVVNAISGNDGLLPSVAAVEAGKTLALANKESIVCGGGFLAGLVKERGAAVVPIDSEHSAILQCLEGYNNSEVEKIYLTASGGPFRGMTLEQMAEKTPEQALNHPKWKMGAKITIDSATMMNKGFEMIEAAWLFGVEPGRIEIAVHPQSVIHSMVQFRDGAILAQLGCPDMRVPIQFALNRPQRLEADYPRLDIFDTALTFERPDWENFPCLRLAYVAVKMGGVLPAVMSAADEAAVGLFLRGSIGFNDIARVIENSMSAYIAKGNTMEASLGGVLYALKFGNEYVLNQGGK